MTADVSTCTSKTCKAVTPGNHKRCSICGKPAVSSAKIRGLGWMMAAIGVLLIGVMGYVWLQLAPAMAQAGQPLSDGTNFRGDAAQVSFVRQLFALVILFGVVALAMGIVQIRTGAKNMILYGIMIALFVALMIQALRSRSVLTPTATVATLVATVLV